MPVIRCGSHIFRLESVVMVNVHYRDEGAGEDCVLVATTGVDMVFRGRTAEAMRNFIGDGHVLATNQFGTGDVIDLTQQEDAGVHGRAG